MVGIPGTHDLNILGNIPKHLFLLVSLKEDFSLPLLKTDLNGKMAFIAESLVSRGP